MQAKEITVGIQRVINLGNYENVRYECSVTTSIEKGDDPTEVYENALNFCKNKVGAEIDRIEQATKLAKGKK